MPGEPRTGSASEAAPRRAGSSDAPFPLAVPLAALFVALSVVAVYAQTLGHGFLLLDDDVYVTNNPQVLQGLHWEGVRWAFAAPRSANYHPLTYLSHMLDAQLFGVASAGWHHGMSAGLHALASVVLFLALRALAGGFWTPLVATLLFALHPLRVESVAWIAERKDVLSGLFFFAALLVYASVARRGGLLRHLLLAAVFAAGLLSKPMLVTLPFVLLLLDFWPLGRVQGLGTAGGSHRAARPARPVALVLEKLPLFALSLALGLVTLLAQEQMGAVRSELPLAGRIANALAAYGGYLVSFVFPARLAIFYPHPVILAGGVTAALLGQAAVSAAVLLAISSLCWRARRRAPHLLVGWLWFLGMLVPTLGLVQVGVQASADRYTYLPSVGLCIMVAWTGAAWLERRPRLRPALATVTSLAIVLLAGASWRYAGFFASNLSVFEHAAAVTDRNYLAHNQIGMSHQAAGDLARARASFERSLGIRPGYDWAHHNLAINYFYEQRYPDAERHFRLTLAANPRHVEARSNLAVLYQGFGRYEESAALLDEALALQPERAELHYNLGTVYFALARWPEAEAAFAAALRHHPGMPGAWRLLGLVAIERGQPERAESHLRRAIAAQPDDVEATDALAELLDTRGNRAEAARLRARRPPR